ncbi:MAG: bifunctional 4-hydroxy-3-methylbut-2-enyl diphosphate reductase/30S ribosomal protein S1 [Oscillospiraceae bacterium]|nr:bifunctional 4-hydroxy-3-methylbut-2-enyl diphosphate reductase/30S ribosomal protein S1 [Oscillospiraceae bacterium]
MPITLAQHSGFCFGVQRAVDAIEQLLAQGKPVALLGQLIHNKQVTEDLRSRGAVVIGSAGECPPGHTLVIRAHGITRQVMDEIHALGLDYCDATCPFVKKIHAIVARAQDLVVIVGDEQHPEVLGIHSYAMGDCAVVASAQQLEDFFRNFHNLSEQSPVLVVQTTFLAQEWKKCKEIMKKHCTNAKIYDTICDATQFRQDSAARLAQRCDAMIVVGDNQSSNARKLVAVAEAHGPAYLVEDSHQVLGLQCELTGLRHIGVTAGASTPGRTIKEALQTMSELTNENVIEQENYPGDDDFGAQLEASLQSMSTDQKVKGIITALNPSEIQVDIGRKQTGYVVADEYSSDPSADHMQDLKVGDELDLIILKTNDAEGTVQLSKRKFDSVAAWYGIEAAEESGEVLEGKVIDVVRGGVLVMTGGMRVFVPASQTGVPREHPLEDLKGQTVQYRVIEVNKQRRRAVGSVKAVTQAARREALANFWATAEVGQVLQGTVRSIMSYGAFVDVGGVDGMVHISEMSWSRIKDPNEVFSVGDAVEVYIKALDEEKRKISLGYRKTEDNPWQILRVKHPEGSVVDATIVSFTPFGAFARVLPGVDGLIHISQIANERVESPQDVLEIGQVVQAQIVGIDFDRRRVSLSMRALLAEEPVAEVYEEVNMEDEVVASFGSDSETVISNAISFDEE